MYIIVFHDAKGQMLLQYTIKTSLLRCARLSQLCKRGGISHKVKHRRSTKRSPNMPLGIPLLIMERALYNYECEDKSTMLNWQQTWPHPFILSDGPVNTKAHFISSPTILPQGHLQPVFPPQAIFFPPLSPSVYSSHFLLAFSVPLASPVQHLWLSFQSPPRISYYHLHLQYGNTVIFNHWYLIFIS